MIMRSAILALLATISFQAIAATPAQTSGGEMTSAVAISPIFSQLLAFNRPLAFHIVNEETSAHGYIRESVLPGETAEQWTQMITVTGYKDVAATPGPPPAVLVNSIAGGFKKACPDTISVGDLGSTPIDGYPAALAFVGCGSVSDGDKAHSETALLLVIKGTRDYYTIQWAERGAAQPGAPTFDQARWVERIKQLMPVALCSKVAGETAPYPSCLARMHAAVGPHGAKR